MTPQQWLAALAAITAATPLREPPADQRSPHLYRRCAEFYEYNSYSLYVSLNSTDHSTILAEIIHDHAEWRDRHFASTEPSAVIAWLNQQHHAARGDVFLEAIQP